MLMKAESPEDYNYGDTDLKGGYKIRYEIGLDTHTSDTLQYLLLTKEGIIIDTISDTSFGINHKSLGYIVEDFSDAFILGHSFGSGNPHYFELYKKESGAVLFDGVLVEIDEETETILYISEYSSDSEELMLYDHKSAKKNKIVAFEDCDCIKNTVGDIRDCVSILNSDDKMIVLGCDDITFMVER